ncbi:hypothetical protein ABQJ54_17960 [Rhodanobacter sp. Si-c]|uniref:Uncharacterized protein n=1 Tax=Rhodanobacter lycopersici TaxID=3162487 RepID=A0ABV3QIH5_9GAMM
MSASAGGRRVLHDLAKFLNIVTLAAKSDPGGTWPETVRARHVTRVSRMGRDIFTR